MPKGKTVTDMLALIKEATAGSEAQTAASGAAAMASKNKEQAAQEAGGGGDIAPNTAAQMGEDVANVKEALKDKVMRAAGKDKKVKEEVDPEVKLNLGQDQDAARTAVLDSGGDPQPPPGPTEKTASAADVLTGLFDELKKTAGVEDDSEVVKIAEDGVAYGRWIARGFYDELMNLSNAENQE